MEAFSVEIVTQSSCNSEQPADQAERGARWKLAGDAMSLRNPEVVLNLNSPVESPPPNEKKLRIVSFAGHAARGLVRDQATRRKAMFWNVIAALLMLFGGETFLSSWLDPHQHLGRFVLYWLVCAWITVTAILLAIFDLLMVRAAARQERRGLEENLAESELPNDDAD